MPSGDTITLTRRRRTPG